MINYIKLTYFCHFGQNTNNSDILCQQYVILDNFLSILCSLSSLDSNMFLSIRRLFPCRGKLQNRKMSTCNRSDFRITRVLADSKCPKTNFTGTDSSSMTNRRLVTDEPVEFEKFKTSGNLPIIFEESMEHTSNESKHQIRKM